MNTIPRRVWLEINLDTLTQNYRKIADAVAPAEVLTVLKANAYGLGVLPIARALAKAGASGFGVAEPYEALQLLPDRLDVGPLPGERERDLPTEPGPRPEPAAADEAEPEASENPVTSFISPSSTIAGFTFGQTHPREG